MPRFRSRTAWLVSAAIHAVAIVLAITIAWQAPRRQTFVVLAPPPPPELLSPYGGTRVRHGPAGGLGRTAVAAERPIATPIPEAPPTALPPPVPPDTQPRARPAVNGSLVPGPALGDGLLWVTPRPALPSEIADQIYGTADTLERNAVVVARLRAMVDTLNRVIDEEQRGHRLPSWTVRGDSGKPQWGLDPQNIYIAGVKIPTAVLALLGNLFPAGNYDEGLRSRIMADMRDDMLRSAARAENLQQFQRYVRELRERKQAEREAQRRAQGDTTKVTP